MDIQKLKNRFTDIVNEKIKRSGVDKLMDYLEKSDFFVCPASTRFHEAYEGGLLEHSLKVYDQLVLLNEAYNAGYSEETLAITALFHDICKIGCYKTSFRNVKNEETGKWEKVPFYEFNEDLTFGGHGSKSVFLIQWFMKLTVEEAVAINCHMGVENGNYDILNAHRQYPIAFLVHTADMAATIDAFNKEENKEEEA